MNHPLIYTRSYQKLVFLTNKDPRGESMSVIRLQKHTDKYVILDKTFLEDQRISLKLKGFLAYCLSKPDHWEFRVLQLASVLKEGRDAIRSVIQEGEEYGYISSTQSKSACGQFTERDYVVHELSIKKETPETGFPAPACQAPDYQAPEKPTQASIEDSKERSACSASAEKNNPEILVETIFYQGRNRAIKSLCRSDVYRHFLGKPYSVTQIDEAIKRFSNKKEPIYEPYKLLELIIEDVKTAPKKQAKQEFNPANYKPTKLKIPV